ncbi:hypothetical protein SAMN05421595_0790 [Austwickia chelonae]|nr:hypothetical protein [Austwickia chelonae]SEW00196.1 hypothetical protein SAMN05421595_0790 [Austwickia chelonae]
MSDPALPLSLLDMCVLHAVVPMAFALAVMAPGNTTTVRWSTAQ